jgi:hypothetical protein
MKFPDFGLVIKKWVVDKWETLDCLNNNSDDLSMASYYLSKIYKYAKNHVSPGLHHLLYLDLIRLSSLLFDFPILHRNCLRL